MCQTTNNSNRQCVICDKQLYGRSDKRFCGIKCKNYYHGQARKSMRTITSETQKILVKNAVILEGVLGNQSSVCVIDQLALERLGFRFNYVTDVENKHGALLYGVYQFTYRFVSKKRILITKDGQRSEVSPYLFKRWSREITELYPNVSTYQGIDKPSEK